MLVTSEFVGLLRKAQGISISSYGGRTTFRLHLENNGTFETASDKPIVENFTRWAGRTGRTPVRFWGYLMHLDTRQGDTLKNAIRKGDRLQAMWRIGNDNDTMRELGITCDECFVDVHRPVKGKDREKFIGRFPIDHVITHTDSLALLGRES